MKNFLLVRTIYVTILFLGLCFEAFAQNTDSLLHKYKQAKGDKRIELLLLLSENELQDSFALAYQFGAEALKLSNKTRNTVLKAKSNYNMGLVYMAHENFDSALFFLHKSHQFYLKEKGVTEELLNTTLKQGECYLLKKENNEAANLFLRAITIAKKINNKQAQIKAYSQVVSIYFKQADYDKTIEILYQQLELANELNDSSIIGEVFNGLSSNNRRLGNYSKAVEFSQKALHIYGLLNDSIGIANSYLSLGAIYYGMDNYNQAIKHFSDAAAIYETRRSNLSLAGIYNNIGSVYIELKEYAKASDYYKKALKIYEESDYLYAIAIVTGNIGLALEGLGNRAQAMQYFAKSLEYQKQLKNKEGIAQAISSIGGLLLAENKLIEAKNKFSQALEIIKQGNYPQVKLSVLEKLIVVEEKLENYKNTVDVMRQYHALKDSLLNEDSRNKLNELQTKLELNQHKTKIELLSKENDINTAKVEKQKAIILGVIFISLLFLILIIIISYALRYNRKAKSLLELQNKKIQETQDEIAIKNKHLTDSIVYASRTQKALLSPLNDLQNVFSNFFLISKPQNIVSGDFYWFKSVAGQFYIALADCTGHGVPGAFMSILGHAFLDEIVEKNPNLGANQILDELRLKIKTSLHQNNHEGNTDGMDISLCIFNKEKTSVEFAGAYNSLYILRQNELIELKADKMPVSIARNETPFSVQIFELQPGDKFYLATDGFYDQFGGQDHSKITRKLFKQLLTSNYNLSIEKQAIAIESFFDNWKATNEQTDDMTVLGFEF